MGIHFQGEKQRLVWPKVIVGVIGLLVAGAVFILTGQAGATYIILVATIAIVFGI